ncbi:hypothetical protein [Falsiroseomonas oryzae]|uniref:hypothetical protein n=1 Tax=Falsiroseomonas oryzae TaxID=2766473 RepID=UPI0022EA2303|nr:hypothetical protein [Roseomonas sp. MO-31]
MPTHAEFSAELTRALPHAKGVKLPAERTLRVDGERHRPTLTLSAAGVAANMQTNAAAFEGWALALMAWLGAGGVRIAWEPPQRDAGPVALRHYRRFLYRLVRFAALMGEAQVDLVTMPSDAIAPFGAPDAVPVLNRSSGGGEGASAEGSEAWLEKRLAQPGTPERRWLEERTGVTALDRQVAVGVFDRVVTKGTEIFTASKSAIDLLGRDAAGDVWLLELKAPGNATVGALSELLFYAAILEDLRRGRIGLKPAAQGLSRDAVTLAQICGSRRIRARLASADIHPLLREHVFPLLNEAVARAELQVEFGWLDLGGLPAGTIEPNMRPDAV